MPRRLTKDTLQPSDFAKAVAKGLRRAAKVARTEARQHGTMLYGAVDGRVVARSPWEGAIVGWVVLNPQTRTYGGALIDGSKATWRGSRLSDVKKAIRGAAQKVHSKRRGCYRFVRFVAVDPRSSGGRSAWTI